MDSLEGDNLLPPKTFDNDPHIIQLPPPHQETGKLEFVRILEKGAPMKLADGRMSTPLGVVMTNQLVRSGYVTSMMKDGYLIISLVRSDSE